MWRKNHALVTLGERVENRESNFDIIRLLAALAVLIAHSLSGATATAWSSLFLGYEPARVAVMAFFVISGFLVTGSLERRSVIEYFQSRALRVIPALTLVSFVTVLIIGPAFTQISLYDYFSDIQTYKYLTNSIPYKVEFYLPGLFKGLPSDGGVNGSLWTIPIEAFCYVLLAIFFLLGRRTLTLILPAIVVIAAFQIFNYFTSYVAPLRLYGSVELFWVLRFGLFFLIGSFCWKMRWKIKLSRYFFLLCLVVLAVGSVTGYLTVALYLALPYFLLYLAYSRKILGGLMNRLGDLSYGTYLFAFPIQQSLVWVFGIGQWTLAFWAATLAMSFAWLSWRYIEKPVLSFKSKRYLNESAVTATL